MIELIYNTLHILAKVTSSKVALLLRVNGSEFELLSSFGNGKNMFHEFNEAIFSLYQNSEIDKKSVANLPACDSILNELGLNNCFVRTVYSVNEQNESVYLFLFSDNAEKQLHPEDSSCMSIINVLSSQLKEFYVKNHDATLSGEEVQDDESIIQNWEENFKTLLKVSNDLIFFLDKNGCFLKVNDTCSMMLDYSEQEVKGKHFLDLVPVDYKVSVAEAISRLLQSDKTLTFNAVLKSKLGRSVIFEIMARTIIRKDKVIGMLGIASDVSKLKKYEEELLKLKPKLVEAQRLISIERARVWQPSSLIEELDRLKSEFISNISHEFRTPLASIIGFSETIVSDPDLPEEMKSEFNNVILNEGKRLAKLINDVLELSNVESSKVVLNQSSFNVIELLGEVVEKNKISSGRKKLKLNYEYTSDEIFIYADKEKLFQSFDALLNNAIKFTNENGRVSVIVRNLFKEVEIIISDTGVGIPKKDLPYIFQKFYRVSRPGTEIPGTGIGLVFVKQMIDLHKGMISVQSEVGSGTTFIIKFLKNFKLKN